MISKTLLTTCGKLRKRCVLELRKTQAKARLQRALLHKHTDYKTFVNNLGIARKDKRILERLIVEFKHKHNSLQSYENIKKTIEWSRHKPNKQKIKKEQKKHGKKRRKLHNRRTKTSNKKEKRKSGHKQNRAKTLT